MELPMFALTFFAAIAHGHARAPIDRPRLARIPNDVHAGRTILYNTQNVFRIAIRTTHWYPVCFAGFRRSQPSRHGVCMAHVSRHHIGRHIQFAREQAQRLDKHVVCDVWLAHTTP